MPFNRFTDPIISNIRTGSGNSPYIELDEPLVIDNSGKVQLTEYPSPYHKVIVTGDDREWFETNNKTPNVNSYKVDYNHKTITFDISNKGKQLSFNYFGMGNSLISSKNIYTQANDNGIIETLDDIITNGREAIDTLGLLNEKIEIVDGATVDAINATTNANQKSQEVAQKLTELNTSEQIRVGNENARKTNETTRLNAENKRVSDENTRILNETSRQANEEARKTAETSRQNTFTSKLTEINEVIKNADGLENAKTWSASTQYRKNNIVEYGGSSFQALVDNIGQPPPTLPTKSNAYWTLLSQKGVDGDSVVAIYKEEFIAVEGQREFTVEHHFDQYQNRTTVFVNGAPQKRPDNYEEISSNTIAFYEGLPAGYRVEISYFSEALALSDDVRTVVTNHTDKISQHEVALSNKLESVIHEKFTSTANQSVFNLTNSYDVGKNRLKVYIEGIVQTSPDNFTETSYKSFTLTESLPVGVKVLAEIYK